MISSYEDHAEGFWLMFSRSTADNGFDSSE
jgi:hypothetical protein